MKADPISMQLGFEDCDLFGNSASAICTEGQLASIAFSLIGKRRDLTPQERILKPKESAHEPGQIGEIRRDILEGNDPLGAALCTLRSAAVRRLKGATYTPKTIVDAMVSWAATEAAVPARIVDPGAGSGRFLIAAAKVFPEAALVAVEIDPLATLLLRANAAVLGFSERLTVVQADYRCLTLPLIDGPTLYIGNPPYVRHHDIEKEWKLWLSQTAKSFGFAASGLAGLHIHFFLKTRAIAQPGDYGVFITASEWMDVNYGSLLRKMLENGLGGAAIHVIDPKALPFAGALTTGAITCFRIGNRPDHLVMSSVESLDALESLSSGRSVDWSELASSRKWSILVRNSPKPVSGHIELGELFRVHRGQVSGNNAVWIAGEAAKNLPDRFLIPTVTRGRELLEANEGLNDSDHLRRVIDLPPDLSGLPRHERQVVDCFLSWAKANGGNEGWIATHRRSWWAVNLREAAPILCTYMARRAPAFVRNHAEARHLNIAHGLYPVEPLSEMVLTALIRFLSRTVGTSEGRTYAGGLVKFEPGEVSRLRIPSPNVLLAQLAQ